MNEQINESVDQTTIQTNKEHSDCFELAGLIPLLVIAMVSGFDPCIHLDPAFLLTLSDIQWNGVRDPIYQCDVNTAKALGRYTPFKLLH